MKPPKKKRGPVAVTTGASENAVPASVQSAYSKAKTESKPDDLIEVPSTLIMMAVLMLSEALEVAGIIPPPAKTPEDSL